jgi:hypothetical protein
MVTIQRIPLTEATRRMKQVRQMAQEDGLVILTSHDKPALIVIEVERGRKLLNGAEQLVQLLAAASILEVAQAISGAAAVELSSDHDWIRRALEELRQLDGPQPKLRAIGRSPNRSVRSP